MAGSGIDWADVQFTKSSYSGTDQGNCVELAFLPGTTALRDSKLGTVSPVLELTEASFRRFLTAVKTGAFDNHA